MPAAVVGDRHPKNRGVDERLTPHHEPELRSLLEQFEQFKMRNRINGRSFHRANGMIHVIEKQSMRIGPVAGDMKRDVLPLAVAHRVITPKHPPIHDGTGYRLVPLPTEIFALLHFTVGKAEFSQRTHVRRIES